MKKVNPNRYVTFITSHIVINPATVLESKEIRTGESYVIAEIPESRIEYYAGQVLEFGSVNAAKEFVKALNVGKVVCQLGGVTP